MTRLGLGTSQLGDPSAGDAVHPGGAARDGALDAAISIVDAAWDAGIRYFDTAPHYELGRNESLLGAALAARPRAEYTISTKVGRLIVDGDAGPERRWDFSAEGVERSLIESLERLAIDRADIVLIHDPQDHIVAEALDLAYPALERLRSAGVVGAIGVGTGNIAALELFARHTDIDVMMIAGRFTLLDRSAADAVLPLCRARGISVLNAGIFNSGLLAEDWPSASASYEYAPPNPQTLERARTLAREAAAAGATLPQSAVDFAISDPAVVSLVIGAESAAQVRRNARLVGLA